MDFENVWKIFVVEKGGFENFDGERYFENLLETGI